VPEGWKDPFFGWNLGLDWQTILPAANKKIAEDGFSLFGLFFTMMLFKGVLNSLAGFAPNYDMQKTLSAKNPVEAAKMAGFVSVVLFPVRYLMVMGVAVLGLTAFNILPLTDGSGNVDFERVLPGVINHFVPAGLLGIVLTALLGAFMGTFSGTLNAAQAYIVNDIYLKYINPAPASKKLAHVNYLAGLLVVTVGILIGFFARDVNSMLQWIVSGLWGGYTAANILKWYWWRFNAKGFYYGMAAGICGALVMSRLFTGVEYLYWFPVLFLVSLAGCLIGTYSAPPTDMNTLVKFYCSVRPWGWWRPVKEQALEENPSFRPNGEFKRDMFNVAIGTVAQTCLTILPMYLVLGMNKELFAALALLLLLGFILKKTWWDKLEN
jgi:Na+/proline symporter